MSPDPLRERLAALVKEMRYGPYNAQGSIVATLKWAEAIEAALRAEPEGDGWQLMETAPRSGEILVWVKRAGLMGRLVAHRMETAPEDHPPIAPGWYYWTGHMFSPLTEPPLYWQPLPAEPNAARPVAPEAKP